MEFKIVGDKKNPVMVWIHAMMTTSASFKELIEYFKEDYYIILPTLDGHTVKTDSTFPSIKEETAKIVNFLKKREIEEVELLLGVSFGGIIALDLFCQKEIKVKHSFFDGVPLEKAPLWKMKAGEIALKNLIHQSAKHPEKSNLLDEVYGSQAPHMKEICKRLSDTSLKNMTRSSYAYQLPTKLLVEEGQSVTFYYGSEEPTKECIPKIKTFKNCHIIEKAGYRHCEYLAKAPEEYAVMLKQILKEQK